MKVNVILKGIFCETPYTPPHTLGRVTGIKGKLTLKQIRTTSPPWEVYNTEVFSTLSPHLGSDGDPRPIYLQPGDLLLVRRAYQLDLQDPIPGIRPDEDYVVLSGDLLGGSRSLTITRADLTSTTRPRAFPLHFAEGRSSVRAEFEVSKEDV
jgi:hypothetical protein